MNTLEALYFPGTEIYSGSQFPVFLLFSTTHLLQPVEASETADNSADIFTTAGLCQVHTPCPLGPNRDRFLRLIRDIRERKDDYAAQLSSLTVASMSAKKPSIDDTQHGIVSSLLGNQGASAEPEESPDTTLWQARLVLKIGEMLDQDEEDVAMQMVLLDDQEEDIFKTLQGEMDDEEESLFSEMQQIREKTSRPTASNVKNRLAAWNKLHLAEKETEPAIWLTHMAEAADILLEKYESTTKTLPTIIAEFELPANIGWSRAEVAQQIQAFHENNHALLAEMKEAIGTATAETIQPLTTRWAAALENAFPRENTGRSSLTFYHFVEKACGTLLGKPDSPGRILAVVRWQE